MSKLEAKLSQYRSRPATRTGAAAEVALRHLNSGLASARLEGFDPLQEDIEIIHLLASGRITQEEADALCPLLAAKPPTSTRP